LWPYPFIYRPLCMENKDMSIKKNFRNTAAGICLAAGSFMMFSSQENNDTPTDANKLVGGALLASAGIAMLGVKKGVGSEEEYVLSDKPKRKPRASDWHYE